MAVTVKQFLDESVQQMSGLKADSCAALAMLNRARELLYPLDDWDGTVEYGVVCGSQSCFFLPWHLETPRTTWTSRNPFCFEGHWNRICYDELESWCHKKALFTRTGLTSVLPFNFPIGMKIGFRLTDTQDEGVKFPVTIQNPFGTIDTEEIQLTEIVNPTFAEMVVGKINHIGKPSTSGGIEIWKMDECEVKTYLFTLQAKEARPSYRQFTFPGCCPSLVVKAKKKFINYSEKDYGVEMDITSASGIRFAIQAIEHERNKKYNEYQAALKLARSHLERKAEDLVPNRECALPVISEPCYSKTSYRYCNW